ncbi:GxxExxY protein [Thermoflexibacter ruber]|uniref:GxxExxY protein n=1 Tax=Thermoflexibacter ruber TaxID=1003 RepID=A0A1I2BRD6_9BACT|nr:GxxExxY protein [Thermoflexibacter ruber]SFE58726.1 GxxExxY protein [Thermoflexibacter ruber]
MTDLIYKDESYQIIGACMEVHSILGRGFLEIVYKDALEHEFKLRNIPFEREKEYKISYKSIVLARTYIADFIVFDKIISEAKCQKGILDEHYKQVINYLAVSKCKLGIIANFSNDSFESKRVVL